MTDVPKLTHEQSTILRAIADDVWVSNYRYIGHPSIGSPELAWAIDGTEPQEPQELSPKGKEALAAYKREWVTVERSVLQNLCEMLLARDPKLGSGILHATLARARLALETT